MQKPHAVSGWCPHFDAPSGYCYLSEQYKDGSTREYHCKSDKNCKTCGNYEAWASGKNYRGK